MSFSTKNIEEYLGKSRFAITNALELTDIKERLVNSGYDDTRLQEGKAIFAPGPFSCVLSKYLTSSAELIQDEISGLNSE